MFKKKHDLYFYTSIDFFIAWILAGVLFSACFMIIFGVPRNKKMLVWTRSLKLFLTKLRGKFGDERAPWPPHQPWTPAADDGWVFFFEVKGWQEKLSFATRGNQNPKTPILNKWAMDRNNKTYRILVLDIGSSTSDNFDSKHPLDPLIRSIRKHLKTGHVFACSI